MQTDRAEKPTSGARRSAPGTMHTTREDRPILDVFVMRIPDELAVEKVCPPERAAYIAAAENERVRRERYAVWKLLETGIGQSFGLRAEEVRFACENGRWSCDRLHFSLSHSHGAAAAAVSDAPVGVDIESVTAFLGRFADDARRADLARRICTERELARLQSPTELLRLWTKKECLYKRGGCGGSDPRELDSGARESLTTELLLPEPYLLSVCGDSLRAVRFFRVDGTAPQPLSITPPC